MAQLEVSREHGRTALRGDVRESLHVFSELPMIRASNWRTAPVVCRSLVRQSGRKDALAHWHNKQIRKFPRGAAPRPDRCGAGLGQGID